MVNTHITRGAIAGTVAGLTLSGCGLVNTGPDPTPDAQALATALSATDLSPVPLAPVPQAGNAQADLTEIVRGMDGIKPSVTSTGVKKTGNSATANLSYAWALPSGRWEYAATAPITWQDKRWVTTWSPTVVHPQLSADTRLVYRNTQATRGRILGNNSVPLAEDRQVLRLGIDKSKVDAATAEASARKLAALVKIDAGKYAERVKSSAAQAFVEAITYRINDEPANYRSIPGAATIDDTRVLPLDRDFAPEIIGRVEQATTEEITEAKGALLPGDDTGQSGLQKRYDEQLRGKPAGTVVTAPRTTSSTPAATPAGSPAPTPTPAATTLFDVPAAAGTDVSITLDVDLQKKAESVLAGVTPAAGLVAIQPSSGKVLAAANSPGSNGNPDATFGRYAPGSTFKVVTALALLRTGMTPDTMLPCTDTVTVDGRSFKNYSDFPTGKIGQLSLEQSLAYSCNTALISQHAKITPQNLREAAASLALGPDYDAGFSSFFGSVPDPANQTGLAESLIGQGKVEASPMAMAAVAASVQAGRTVQPHLVTAKQPPAAATPLTAAEGAALQRMMAAVVRQGTGQTLSGVAEGAKTGTAEYGTTTPPRTRAWMIAYRGDLAVAVLVADGESGSQTAAPLIRSFLS